MVAVLGGCRTSPCESAIKHSNWTEVRAVCTGVRWTHWRELARAWQAHNDEDFDSAIRWAEPLLTTEVEADAAYLLGYAYSHHDVHRANAFMERAFHRHLRGGNHTGASKAAAVMVETFKSDFVKRLFWANLAIEESSKSGDPVIHGGALRSLARAYDRIGMAHEAQKAFLEAEKRLVGSPEALAHTYLKHGIFLVDHVSLEDLRLALRYYDDAEAQGLSEVDRFALWLNRVFAHSRLKQFHEAAQALVRTGIYVAEHKRNNQELSRLELVAGHLAAHRGDVARATAHFQAAERLDRDYDLDYAWEMQLALAGAFQQAGRRDEQLAALRKAVEIIQRVRANTDQLELRPWVLQRRRKPHEELFLLLFAQGQPREALALAEYLDASTWLDKMLGSTAATVSKEQALAAARLRPQLQAASSPASQRQGEVLFYFSLRDQIWRAHLVDGEPRSFERLPDQTREVVTQLTTANDQQQALARAASLLLPNDLSSSSAPLHIIANSAPLDLYPFAALPWRGRPLIAARPIIRGLSRSARRCTLASAPTRSVLLADSLDNLPAARREVQNLAAKLAIEPSLGKQATLARVKEARGAALLHIATHGNDTTHGRVLALADRELAAAEAAELFDGAAPETVVLSGCATAQNTTPEPWNSLVAGFLAAGSRHVIATLRSVEDDGAAQMMHAYYTQPEHLPPPERLAAAQRTLMDTSPHKVWASFTVWGGDCADPSSTEQTAQLAR